MDECLAALQIPAMPAPVKKFNARFADYDLNIRCRKCGHVRVTEPHALAKILGVGQQTLEVGRGAPTVQ